MKTQEEIEQLAEKYSAIGMNAGLTHREYTLERIAYCRGYEQCQEDMADKKYTEEDMLQCWNACLDFNKPAGLDSGINYKDYINSLNKQD